MRQAEALAARAEREAGDEPEARIRWLWETLYARPPSAGERQGAGEILSDLPWRQFCQVLLLFNEFTCLD